jgi:hypothetical protein
LSFLEVATFSRFPPLSLRRFDQVSSTFIGISLLELFPSRSSFRWRLLSVPVASFLMI